MDMNRNPIFVFGAARSGTKIFRNVLATHPAVAAFPSEIDFIWRYGNQDFPLDALCPEQAHPTTVRYIRRQFAQLQRRYQAAYVVDKSVANSLRIEFVHHVFPQAHFIHLIRDGRAVVESARRCWQGDMEAGDYWNKFKSVGWLDILSYGPNYLRFRRQRRAERMFGPRFAGIHQLVAKKPILEVCALQWRACVQTAAASLAKLPAKQVTTIYYEEFVRNPVPVVQRVMAQIGLTFAPECQRFIDQAVHEGNVQKWRDRLQPEELAQFMPHIADELGRHGYQR